VTPLEELADSWVADFRDAHHLRRAREWLLVLEPDADEALRLAALTHDMERHYPGGPQHDPMANEPDDPAYNGEHQARSARIVGEWLREHGADDSLAGDVSALVLVHEFGGDPRADLLQAADSISFLETKSDLMVGWLRDGRADLARALRQPDWMLNRTALARARELARPFYDRAVAEIEEAARGG
jgi:hypothetical protein